MTETTEEVKARLNRETAKIDWTELQRFYARGEVIAVDQSLDLIEVACQLHQDNKPQVEDWLQQGLLARASDQQAQQWHDQQALLWAVVIAPWVLVQQPKPPTDDAAPLH